MKLFHKFKTGVGVGGVLLAIAGSFLYSAPDAAAQTANTLKVSPVRTDTIIKPGETGTVQTTITNLTGQAITVHPMINDFIAGDEDGTPALILDEDEYAPTHSLKRFITPIADVTIPANDAKTITVTISVPADAQPGGYFGAVRFAPTSPDGGGQVNLSASVASLILLAVPGDAIELLQLTDFTVQQNSMPGTLFFDGKNITTYLRFENKGSAQLGPFGKLSVVKGDTVVYEKDFNNETPREVILPDSARRWELPIESVNDFGYYKVLGTFTYGEKNITVEVVSSFWVVPMPVVLIAAGILAVLLIGCALTIVIIVRRSRRRRRGPTRSRLRRR